VIGPKGPVNSVSGTIRAAPVEDTGAFRNLDSISQVGEPGDSSGAAPSPPVSNDLVVAKETLKEKKR
jgi:hypothetical protein